MTINNLQSALELWDNGFNIIPIKSDPITPTQRTLLKILEITKLQSESGNSIKIREKPVR